MQGKESLSFSIVDEDDFNFDEEMIVENSRDIATPKMARNQARNAFNLSQKGSVQLLGSDSEDDDGNLSPKRYNPSMEKHLNSQNLSQSPPGLSHQGRIPSAGPSGRQTITKIHSPTFRDRHNQISSDSDSEESEAKKIRAPIPGEYDPAQYENLQVNNDIKELFQYILKYTPQSLNLDFKFKPFIPDFIPAVGDIDAFLKVVPPELSVSGEPFKCDQSILGLIVLDEPAANQSDPALLHLQLRATSVNVSHTTNMVVKKVENIEKNSKVIDKWIKDISDLHRTKSSPVVKYSDPMPDLDDLMQEWPEKMENLLKNQGFPSYKLRGALTDYIDIVCCIFDIPVYKNRIQSLYLLFSLFAAIKNSQLYKAANTNKDNSNFNSSNINPDQLVLD